MAARGDESLAAAVINRSEGLDGHRLRYFDGQSSVSTCISLERLIDRQIDRLLEASVEEMMLGFFIEIMRLWSWS